MISNSIPIASLTIYGILTFTILYIAFRHGKHGLLGWLYLFAFCTLRIVGSVMQISASSAENADQLATAALISSIGLSPLLLAASGILHEVRVYLIRDGDKKMELGIVLFIHLLVATGVALIGVGSSAFKITTSIKLSTYTPARIGMILLLLSWVAISVLAVLIYLARYNSSAVTSCNDGTKLLYALLTTLPFILIRVIYSVVYLFTRSSTLNPVTGSVGVRVGLSFIPELLTCLIFVYVGIITNPGDTLDNRGDSSTGGRQRRKKSRREVGE